MQADLFQNLSSYIFYLQSGRKDREEYIKNIKKHQKDLWAYGISGDIPIIFLTIEEDDDISLVITMVKFYSYLKLKGVKVDFVIFNNEEVSYDEPLQKSILQAVYSVNAGNTLNRSAGIYIHNKSTMGEEIKDFLIGISSIYVDSKNGSLSEQFRKCVEIDKKANYFDDMGICVNKYSESNIYSRSNVLAEAQNVNISELQRAKYGTDIEDDIKDEKYKPEAVKTQNNIHSKGIEEYKEHEFKMNDTNDTDEGKKAVISDDYYSNNLDIITSDKYDESNPNRSENYKHDGKFKINYDEYDNDVDYIKDSDLIRGVDNSDKDFEKSQGYNNENTSGNGLSYDKLDFFNGYGGFDRSDNTYVIKLSNYKDTPAPWINVISNSDFGFHISESGSSYTWCGNSRENKITPWSNDYIRDPISEALYIRDDNDGRYFSISPKPVRDKNEYIIKHGFGYSQFMHTACNIEGSVQVFAPKDEKVKLQIIKLKNLLNEEREVSLFYYAKLVLGVYGYDSERYITTYIVKKQSDTSVHYHNINISSEDGISKYNAYSNTRDNNMTDVDNSNVYDDIEYIGGNNPYSEYFGNLHAYLTIVGGHNLTVCGDTKEFIGFGGEVSSPKALKYKNLSNRTGSIYDPCLSACSKVKLSPYEEKEIVIVFGQDTEENITAVIDKYKDIENVHAALEHVKEYWNDFLGNIQVSTPDKSMDYMLNGWLLYQTLSCRYLSRSAFYQSGGAYGFRDQLQDSIALGVVDPEIPKLQIIRSASRQYMEGDVQHWWHPVVNSGIRTRFSDDLLWMPYVTAEYINTTGDYDILKINAPYLKDEPLNEGEDERYTIVNSSSEQGTIYEHCQRAINKALKFGEHNIPLMGSGDWNDGMSTVGNKGRGESVWLGWFLYDILNRFERIAEHEDDSESALYYRQQKKFIKDNLEKNAWDGGWYRRAYFDDGTPLGSRENPECQIDSLAQSWAVISGASILNESQECDDESSNRALEISNASIDEEIKKINNSHQLKRKERYSDRALEAMEAVERNLVKKDKGMILLLAPPFNDSYLEPGYIKGYVPGVRENGGQYTHAAVWVILALTKLGFGDKAAEYYNMINPINHTKSELECSIYKTEPYVMSADVYIKEPHGGRGGWSWYTGASGWMYRVGIENILGLRRIEDKGYEIKPCIPKSWNEYEIRIKNKTENYRILVKRIISGDEHKYEQYQQEIQKKCEDCISKMLINGEVSKDNIIPRNSGSLTVEVYIY